MYNKVVVPLDGSKLAEVVLPHLEHIAKGCSIPDIILVSVTEEMKGKTSKAYAIEGAAAREFHMAPQTGPLALGSTFSGMVYSTDLRTAEAPVEFGKMAKTAWNYLMKIGLQLRKNGLNTSVSVLVGNNPAEEIIHFAKEQAADLVVIASRGKTGFNRWDMGNVADKVIRASDITVVLVKPKPGFKETKAKRRGKPN
jgi:nucleotide-binding universal stress UspA family protein